MSGRARTGAAFSTDLSDAALTVYGFAERRPGATAGMVATATGIALRVVNDAIGELVDADLLYRSDSGRLSPTNPCLALDELANRHWRDLAARHRRLQGVYQAQQRVFEALSAVPGAEGEPAAGCAAAQVEPVCPHRLGPLLSGVRHVLRLVCPTPLLTQLHSGEPAAGLAYPALARMAGRMNLVVQRSCLNSLSTYRLLRMLGRRGARLRVADAVPLPFAILDEAAVLAGHPVRADQDVMMLRGRPVVDLWAAVFDHLWSTSDHLPARHPVRVRDEPEPDGLGAQQQAVLRLLACGAKDEAMARHLGVSLRTLRRIVSETMTKLGAQSRFQAGLIAASYGLLDRNAPGRPPVDRVG